MKRSSSTGQDGCESPSWLLTVAAGKRLAVAAARSDAKMSILTADSVEMVVRDEAMLSVLKLADEVAFREASILITGENGTGKEILARYIHGKSARVGKPFVSVNCAAISEGLLESELFGHERGAFAGAAARQIGKFEEASGGTLLLDEISEMSVRLQAKLLRAIQRRLIERIGGGKPVMVNVRIIATSSRDLTDAVSEGRFREDLLNRLNAVTLKIPSLRDRPADILALAEYFGGKYAEINGIPERPFSPDAKRELIAARWLGNVRELKNTIHFAVLLASGIDIGGEVIRSTAPAARAVQKVEALTRALVGRTVAEVERDLILDTLDHCHGNRTRAARILGISLRTLRNKLKGYHAEGINVPESGTTREQSRLPSFISKCN